MTRLNQLLEKLGINKSDYLLTLEDNKWKKEVPCRLQKGLEKINPDCFFIQKNRPVALFFDFSKEENEKRKKIPEQIWNLGGVPVIFIINNDILEIYNGFSFDEKNRSLEKITNINNAEENYSIWGIFSGKSWGNLPSPKNLVDERLLQNLQEAKKILEKNGLENNYAQNIIGRLVFSRYLIDRGVKIDKRFFSNKNSFLGILKNKNKKLLYEYFDYLKKTFNGDLFPVEEKEKQGIKDVHLEVLYHLFNGYNISNGQQSLFDIYNFEIIPIELISEVYERFIGIEKQRAEGAFYTPSFLVDYILEKTVKKHLIKHNSCKVFDPSCGSGIFLVEALRHIIERNLINNKKISTQKLKNIIKENIFGVEKDENALNLSVFSLCLTLLDYIDPKDITQFKFPTLKNENLFVADFFDLENIFNKKIENLDFIVGNPPWGSTKKNSSHIRYSNDENIPISDNQIAQSFTARVKDFSSKKTKCALILTSKILYNHNAKEFRKYWLDNFAIDEILELSSVRAQIFERPTAPSIIIFYRYSPTENIKNNIVVHTSIKPNVFFEYLKLIVIEKNDTKEIKQEYFQKYDWLWKILLYGNVFDFYFIKRLKEEYQTIQSLCDKNNITFGAGFKRANKKNKLEHFSNKFLLKPNDLYSYKLPQKNLKLINEYPDLLFENGGVEKVYEKPHILLKRALKDRPILTYSEDEIVFPNTIFGIQGDNKDILKTIGAYFSSSLVRYLLFLTSSTWGIEREEVLQGEYKKLPFFVSKYEKNNLSKIFDDLLSIVHDEYNKKIFSKVNHKKLIQEKIEEINLFLANKFELSEQDKILIDYNVNISIPLFFGGKEPILECTQRQLKDYAQIFLDYFSSRWNGNPWFFEIDIYSNKYVIGMNFKVAKKKRAEAIKFREDSKQTENLFKLMELGKEKITDKFYKERDVRGFNKTSFYAIKSNQYKNWHPAIARADLHEFIEAMMRSEIESLKF